MADFGLARLITNTGGTSTKTTTKCGTPAFQAPEQFKDEPITCKADVYAVGCVLVELFGGRPLWPNLQPFQIMYKVGIEKILPEHSHVPSTASGEDVPPHRAREKNNCNTSAQVFARHNV